MKKITPDTTAEIVRAWQAADEQEPERLERLRLLFQRLEREDASTSASESSTASGQPTEVLPSGTLPRRPSTGAIFPGQKDAAADQFAISKPREPWEQDPADVGLGQLPGETNNNDVPDDDDVSPDRRRK